MPESLLALDISELVNIPVVTASRREQALWQAPAVVLVLDGEDLRRRGVRSVAEALAGVPGFHVVDDGVGHSVVVRGIGAGQRAYGRTLKVMLDGQPLGLRSDASQFLGPELLPMSLIERIEIVRGPASALYGADAYLGVIHIITRRDDARRLQLAAGHEAGSGDAVAAEAMATASGGDWQGMAAVSVTRQDRSGRELPDSSPLPPAERVSAHDIARPQSVYLRLLRQQADARHALMFHGAQRDSHGEFLDFGVLSHRNRVAVQQHTLGWQSVWQTGVSSQRLRIAHAWGGVAEDERLDLGQAGSHPERDFGYRVTELGLEHQRQFGRHHFLLGMDGSWNDEQPFDVFSINDLTGDKVRLSPD
ncbi:MAG: TonB-dependent receptor, partial [Moraxellaceae bacterium]